jgi:uncharacterized protein YjiS (DUF1127 family)
VRVIRPRRALTYIPDRQMALPGDSDRSWDQNNTMSEKTMRTLYNTTARLQSVATQPGQFSQLIANLQSWWLAFLDWRIQREAIFQLEALSDRELKDIGLRRCEIESAVMSKLPPQQAFGRRL